MHRLSIVALLMFAGCSSSEGARTVTPLTSPDTGSEVAVSADLPHIKLEETLADGTLVRIDVRGTACVATAERGTDKHSGTALPTRCAEIWKYASQADSPGSGGGDAKVRLEYTEANGTVHVKDQASIYEPRVPSSITWKVLYGVYDDFRLSR